MSGGLLPYSGPGRALPASALWLGLWYTGAKSIEAADEGDGYTDHCDAYHAY